MMNKTTLYLDGVNNFSRQKGKYSIEVTNKVMDAALYLFDKGYKMLYVRSFCSDDYIWITRPNKKNEGTIVDIGKPFSRWILVEYKKLKRREND